MPILSMSTLDWLRPWIETSITINARWGYHFDILGGWEWKFGDSDSYDKKERERAVAYLKKEMDEH